MKKMARSLVLVSLMLIFAGVSVAADKKASKKVKVKRPAATAGNRSAGLLKRFPEADKNKDGKLSKEEMKAFRTVMAEKMAAKMLKDNPQADTNKDGKLSRKEIGAFRKAHAKKPRVKKDGAKDKKGDHGKKGRDEHSKRNPWANPTPEMVKSILKRHPEADKNKDGKLDKTEMEALRAKFMNRPMPAERAKKMLAEHPEIDANKDGKLTMGEVQKWYQAQKKAKAPAKTGKKKGTKGPKKKGPSEEQLAKMLKKSPAADANKDGKLSAKEAMAFRKAKGAAMLLKKYPDADKNKDGKLSADEMKKLKKTLKEAQKVKKEKGKKGKGNKKSKGKKK